MECGSVERCGSQGGRGRFNKTESGGGSGGGSGGNGGSKGRCGSGSVRKGGTGRSSETQSGGESEGVKGEAREDVAVEAKVEEEASKRGSAANIGRASFPPVQYSVIPGPKPIPFSPAMAVFGVASISDLQVVVC